MKNALFIIAQINFRDEELLEPKKILELNGIKCFVASITKEMAVGMLGLEVIPDFAVNEVKAAAFDLIIVVGGQGSPSLANYPEVFRILHEAKALGKGIASICLGGVVLAKSGVLNGFKATVFPSPDAIKCLKEYGARYIPIDIVADGQILTATSPKVAKQFGQALIKTYFT